MSNSIKNVTHDEELIKVFTEFLKDPLQNYVLEEISNNPEEASFCYIQLANKFSLDREMAITKLDALIQTGAFQLVHRTKCCFNLFWR